MKSRACFALGLVLFFFFSLAAGAGQPQGLSQRCRALFAPFGHSLQHRNLNSVALDIETKMQELEERVGPGYKGRTPEEKRLVEIANLLREARKIAQDHLDLDEFVPLPETQVEAKADQDAQAAKLAALVPAIREKFIDYLSPPPEAKTFLVEITGWKQGDRSEGFAQDLAGMYARLAKEPGVTVDIVESDKKMVLRVSGKNAWKFLRHEPGRHRFQYEDDFGNRKGKQQDLELSVAVFPEPEPTEFVFAEKDLEIQTFSAGGPGGQHQNKTQSGVRVIHKPTGLAFEGRSERSQGRNKEEAIARLRAELANRAFLEAQKSIQDARRSQVGTSGAYGLTRVRNYNLQAKRIKDDKSGAERKLPSASLDGFSVSEFNDPLQDALLNELLGK